jgi:uncharacterized protein YecT (DUF1311 family)
VDANTIEVLDWVMGAQTSDDPRMNKAGWVVMDGPRLVLVKRTGNDTFAGEELTLKFRLEGKELEMERGPDVCNGMGGDYAFTHTEKVIKPSFSCAKAKGAREQAICGNAELAMLDQHLSVAYRAAERRTEWKYGTASVRTAKLKALSNSQAKWWSGDLAKCQSAECVAPLYQARIQYLTELEADEK